MHNLKNLSTAGKLAMISPAAFVVGVIATSGIASATPYSATTDATTAADSLGTQAGPVIAAVFGSVIGVLVLFWAVSYLRKLLGTRKG